MFESSHGYIVASEMLAGGSSFDGDLIHGATESISRAQGHLRKQFREGGSGESAGGFPRVGGGVCSQGGRRQQILGIARCAAGYVRRAFWPHRERGHGGVRAGIWEQQGSALSNLWDRPEWRGWLSVASVAGKKAAGTLQRGRSSGQCPLCMGIGFVDGLALANPPGGRLVEDRRQGLEARQPRAGCLAHLSRGTKGTCRRTGFAVGITLRHNPDPLR